MNHSSSHLPQMEYFCFRMCLVRCAQQPKNSLKVQSLELHQHAQIITGSPVAPSRKTVPWTHLHTREAQLRFVKMGVVGLRRTEDDRLRLLLSRCRFVIVVDCKEIRQL